MINLHHPLLLEIDKLEPSGYFSSSNTQNRGGHPCGGKSYFKYHPNATHNPYTGEVRAMNNIRKLTSETTTLKKETDRNPTNLLSDYLLNNEEGIYKENRVYETNKIYEELKELIEKLSLYKVTKSKPEKNTTKKKPKKNISDKEEVKEQLEKDELNSKDKEMIFLWNLWLLLILTNPQIDRRLEFLREFLFVSNNLLKASY